jgi:hypothetical protein
MKTGNEAQVFSAATAMPGRDDIWQQFTDIMDAQKLCHHPWLTDMPIRKVLSATAKKVYLTPSELHDCWLDNE